MKALKVIGALVAVYLVVIIAFESMLGYTQPANEHTLMLTVSDDDGQPHQRVLARIEHEDQLYVAVNHWPRAWFHALQKNPSVTVEYADISMAATAIVITDQTELASVDAARPLGIGFRILTGFPPRHFVRLDPI